MIINKPHCKNALVCKHTHTRNKNIYCTYIFMYMYMCIQTTLYADSKITVVLRLHYKLLQYINQNRQQVFKQNQNHTNTKTEVNAT